jgi:hypothetical protein
MREARSELSKGALSHARLKEVSRIAQWLTKYEQVGRFNVTLAASSTGIAGETGPIDIMPSLYWLCSYWPGKTYLRLLYRMACHAADQMQLDVALRTIWDAT